MRFCNKAFAKGLVVGLVIGLVTTITLSATASTGKKAWDKFGYMFKSGYVAGFLDCVRIAKGYNDKGYLATNYALPPGASGAHWVKVIDQLYEDERYKERQLPQIIVIAGEQLEKKFGKEIKPSNPGMGGLRAFFATRRKAMSDAKKAKAASESGEQSAHPDAKKGSKGKKSHKAGKKSEPEPQAEPQAE